MAAPSDDNTTWVKIEAESTNPTETIPSDTPVVTIPAKSSTPEEGAERAKMIEAAELNDDEMTAPSDDNTTWVKFVAESTDPVETIISNTPVVTVPGVSSTPEEEAERAEMIEAMAIFIRQCRDNDLHEGIPKLRMNVAICLHTRV